MRVMGTLALVAIAITGIAWCHSESGSTSKATNDSRELAGRVVNDIATVRGGIRWHASAMLNQTGTQHAVDVYNDQSRTADVQAIGGGAWVRTPTWTIGLDLTRVIEVVCVRRFIHEPAPGTVLRSISFRKGADDEDGFADE